MATITSTITTVATSSAARAHPISDTEGLLHDFATLEATGYALIAGAAGGRTAVVPALGLHLADSGVPTPFGNLAHLTKPVSEAEAGDVVAAVRDFFGAGAGGPFLLFSPWPTPDLGAHGLHLGGHPPFMVRPASRETPWSPALRIVEAASAHDVAQFERTLSQAYPAPEMLPFGSQRRLFADALGAGPVSSPVRLFLGYLGDRCVATAAAFVGERVVAVEAVSVDRAARGRGVGAAITAAAAATAGDRPSALVASDLGRSVYAGLGFMQIHRYTLWMGMR